VRSSAFLSSNLQPGLQDPPGIQGWALALVQKKNVTMKSSRDAKFGQTKPAPTSSLNRKEELLMRNRQTISTAK
jgi:hypothetical protein